MSAAKADGRLAAGGSVVEYTGGSTGVSLALVCAVKGYPLHIVSSDAFAREKLEHMKVLGAKLQIVHSESGGMTEKLTRDMVEAARIIAEETGSFWTDQLKNTDQLTAYGKLAEEIWTQTEGRVDGFVQSVGTAASLRGTAEGLRRHREESESLPWSPRSLRSCRAVSRALTRSTASGRALSCRSGGPKSPIRLSVCRRRKPGPWPCGWHSEEGLFAGTSTGCQCHCGLEVRGATGAGSDGCDGHVRYGDEISQQVMS